MLVLRLETAVRRRRVLRRSWTPEEKGLSREPLSASGAPGRDNDFLRVATARASADGRQAKERRLSAAAQTQQHPHRKAHPFPRHRQRPGLNPKSFPEAPLKHVPGRGSRPALRPRNDGLPLPGPKPRPRPPSRSESPRAPVLPTCRGPRGARLGAPTSPPSRHFCRRPPVDPGNSGMQPEHLGSAGRGPQAGQTGRSRRSARSKGN